MKFGTDILETILVLCLIITTIAAFLVMGGGYIENISSEVTLTNTFLLIIIGALFMIAIILLRIYEAIHRRR